MKLMSLRFFWFAACFTVAGQVNAHTPYLLPSAFEPPRGGWVAFDASFADKFFVPEVAFDNSQFNVTSPDGQTQLIADVHYGKTRATTEYKLEAEGTYRFSTGRRYGAVFRTYELDGKRQSLRDPKAELPAGAKLLTHFQAVTHAETYVSKGAPGLAALKPYGQGLELVFQSHPNDLYANSPIKTKVLFEGKPLAEQLVSVYLAARDGNDEAATFNLKTDEAGVLTFTPEKAGTYLLLSRHRAAAPKTADVPEYSYSYTVVIDVTP